MRVVPLILLFGCDEKARTLGYDTGPWYDDFGGDDIGYTDTAPTDPWDWVRVAIEGDLGSGVATGASVAVMANGEIVFAEGFGAIRPYSDEEVTPETLFNIGGDTMKITAISVLQQVEAGRLSLDSTLAEALPGFSFASDPDLADEITLHHLLTHTSGLADDANWMVDADDAALASYATGEFAANGYAMLPAGVAWNPSHPNYSLAGLAAETAAGLAWADLVTRDVFVPLGMEHSFARASEVQAQPDVAVGRGITNAESAVDLDFWERLDHRDEQGSMPVEDFPDGAWLRPAVGAWSTPTDLLKLAKFLMDGDERVLSEASRMELVTEHVSLYPDVPIVGYGYGLSMYSQTAWWDDEWHAVPLWFHGGKHLAYTSTFWALPDQGVAVCVLSNGYEDDFTTSALSALLMALGDAPLPDIVEAPDNEVDPSTFVQLEGAWLDSQILGAMTLRQVGDEIEVSLPDVEALGYSYQDTLMADWPGHFQLTIEGEPLELTFITPPLEEEPRYAVNRAFVFTRVESGPEAIAPPDARRAAIESLLWPPETPAR